MEEDIIQDGLVFEIATAQDGPVYAWLSDFEADESKHLSIPSHINVDGIDYEVMLSSDEDVLSSLANLESISIDSDHPTLTLYQGNLYSRNMEMLFWISPETEVLHIPSDVKYLAVGAFSHASNLESISIETDHPTLTLYQDGLYSKDMEILYWQSPNTVTYNMPDSVDCIGPYVFMHAKALEKIVFSKALKTINPEDFENCYNLKSVDIPEGIEIIDDNAFCGVTIKRT